MKDEQVYKEIIDAILQSKIETFGQLALNKARAVSDIEFSEEGKVVSFFADPLQALDNLLAKFEEFSGVISNYTAQVEIMKIVDRYPDIELPDRLKN